MAYTAREDAQRPSPYTGCIKNAQSNFDDQTEYSFPIGYVFGYVKFLFESRLRFFIYK